MHFLVLADELVVARFPSQPPATTIATLLAEPGAIASITRTVDEWSIVCSSAFAALLSSSSSVAADAGAPADGGVKREAGWRALRIAGVLDFSLVGILASVSSLLAAAGVSIFALSTYDTDYILVKSGSLAAAVAALSAAGHTVEGGSERAAGGDTTGQGQHSTAASGQTEGEAAAAAKS